MKNEKDRTKILNHASVTFCSYLAKKFLTLCDKLKL